MPVTAIGNAKFNASAASRAFDLRTAYPLPGDEDKKKKLADLDFMLGEFIDELAWRKTMLENKKLRGAIRASEKFKNFSQGENEYRRDYSAFLQYDDPSLPYDYEQLRKITSKMSREFSNFAGSDGLWITAKETTTQFRKEKEFYKKLDEKMPLYEDLIKQKKKLKLSEMAERIAEKIKELELKDEDIIIRPLPAA